MISRDLLLDLYVKQGKSMSEIASKLVCSVHKVQYWMKQHGINARSRSEATYIKANPNGDPFTINKIDTSEKAELYGLGVGLYWGEGTKANQHSVRLGNSDYKLIQTFMEFLHVIYDVPKSRLVFGIQLFSDIDSEEALEYWSSKLNVHRTQFMKTYITPSTKSGSYRKKSKYGVLTLYFHNKKLRDILVSAIPKDGIAYK